MPALCLGDRADARQDLGEVGVRIVDQSDRLGGPGRCVEGRQAVEVPLDADGAHPLLALRPIPHEDRRPAATPVESAAACSRVAMTSETPSHARRRSSKLRYTWWMALLLSVQADHQAGVERSGELEGVLYEPSAAFAPSTVGHMSPVEGDVGDRCRLAEVAEHLIQ